MKPIRNEINIVKLKSTLYVPDLCNNLLSVANVTDNGFTVTYNQTSNNS